MVCRIGVRSRENRREGSGFRVLDAGERVLGSGCMILGRGFWVLGSGFGSQGLASGSSANQPLLLVDIGTVAMRSKYSNVNTETHTHSIGLHTWSYRPQHSEGIVSKINTVLERSMKRRIVIENA
jgi:hypothetical protein